MQRVAVKTTARTQTINQMGAPNASGLICKARTPKKKRPAPNTQSPIVAQYLIPAN